MSNSFAPRILALLRQLDYPGASNFTERDIEIIAQKPTEKAIFAKLAGLYDSQFLDRKQIDILKLASEMNDPNFLPLDPVEVRKQMDAHRKKEKEQKRLRMRQRHQQEEIDSLQKQISVLKEEAASKAIILNYREKQAALFEQQVKRAEEGLKSSQVETQQSLTAFSGEVQQRMKEMRLLIEKLKKTDGLRAILDDETYINLANNFIDIIENAHVIISGPELSPHKYAIQIGNEKVAVIKTLERAMNTIDKWCREIIDALRALGQESFAFMKVSEELGKYRQHLENAITEVINDLFDTAASVNKTQLEQLEPILKDVEVATFSQKCALLEELRLLEATNEMIGAFRDWKQSILPMNETLSSTSANRTALFSTTLSSDNTFHPGFSSTILESTVNSSAGSAMSSMCQRRAFCLSSQFDEVFESISSDIDKFHQIADQIESDRKILCGSNGIRFMSEIDEAQLAAVTQKTTENKTHLSRLIKKHDELLKDARDQNQAHYKRLLIPLFVLDRQKYEEIRANMGISMNIFE